MLGFKKLLLLLSLLVVAALAWGIFYITSFHIVKTSPKNSDVYANTAYLDIYFNRALSAKDVQVSSSPSIIQSYSLTGPKTLRLTWSSPLIESHKYEITIISLHSLDGDQLRNKKIAFSVKTAAGLSGEQQRAVVNSQDKNVAADKVNALLPHYDPYYKLEARPNGGKRPDIIFTYLAPPADMQASAPDKAAALKQAKAWLSRKGIDVSQYTLIDFDTNHKLN